MVLITVLGSHLGHMCPWITSPNLIVPDIIILILFFNYIEFYSFFIYLLVDLFIYLISLGLFQESHKVVSVLTHLPQKDPSKLHF